MNNSLSRYLTLILILLLAPCSYSEVAIIVNQANTATPDTEEIAKIFLGKTRTFSDGSPVLPLNLAEGNPQREAFTSTVLGRTSSQLKAYWSKLIFTGKGSPPKEMASDAEIIAAIESDRTAIGYVNASSAKGNVKVLHKF